jgi:hypothetical protein
VRKLHDEAGLPFIEVYVRVPAEVAEERDPKGLYKKARAGEIKGFTGIDDPYEEPEVAEITLPTHEYSVEDSVRVLLNELDKRGRLLQCPARQTETVTPLRRAAVTGRSLAPCATGKSFSPAWRGGR